MNTLADTMVGKAIKAEHVQGRELRTTIVEDTGDTFAAVIQAEAPREHIAYIARRCSLMDAAAYAFRFDLQRCSGAILGDESELDVIVLESWLYAYACGKVPATRVRRELRKLGYTVDLREHGADGPASFDVYAIGMDGDIDRTREPITVMV